MTQVQEKVLINQVSAGMQLSSFLLPGEFNSAYGLMHQTRQVGYFALPISDFKSQVKVTQKDIEDNYRAHQKDFVAPMQVSFDYLILDPKVMSKSIKISDQEVHQYYSAHRANYSTPQR